MHRLQPVADIGQRPRHDHAHRVIEVGALHLLLDGDRGDVEGRRVWWRRCIGQIRVRALRRSGLSISETPALSGQRFNSMTM